MKGIQCHRLFGGIAHKNNAFLMQNNILSGFSIGSHYIVFCAGYFGTVFAAGTTWYNILKQIIDFNLFLGERGLAFQGSSQRNGDSNDRNFLDLIELLSQWDPILRCSSAVATLAAVLNQLRQACFMAASRPDSGVWLNYVPNNRVGTFIDNDTLRIGVALRVGLTVCIPHRCKCGTTVDTFGTHPLLCRFSAWRIPRHSALSDVVRRGLSAAGIPSMFEPSGLDRGDGKRPDGITVYPY